jgi:hypothetical protein
MGSPSRGPAATFNHFALNGSHPHLSTVILPSASTILLARTSILRSRWTTTLDDWAWTLVSPGIVGLFAARDKGIR